MIRSLTFFILIMFYIGAFAGPKFSRKPDFTVGFPKEISITEAEAVLGKLAKAAKSQVNKLEETDSTIVITQFIHFDIKVKKDIAYDEFQLIYRKDGDKAVLQAYVALEYPWDHLYSKESLGIGMVSVRDPNYPNFKFYRKEGREIIKSTWDTGVGYFVEGNLYQILDPDPSTFFGPIYSKDDLNRQIDQLIAQFKEESETANSVDELMELQKPAKDFIYQYGMKERLDDLKEVYGERYVVFKERNEIIKRKQLAKAIDSLVDADDLLKAYVDLWRPEFKEVDRDTSKFPMELKASTSKLFDALNEKGAVLEKQGLWSTASSYYGLAILMQKYYLGHTWFAEKGKTYYDKLARVFIKFEDKEFQKEMIKSYEKCLGRDVQSLGAYLSSGEHGDEVYLMSASRSAHRIEHTYTGTAEIEKKVLSRRMYKQNGEPNPAYEDWLIRLEAAEQRVRQLGGVIKSSEAATRRQQYNQMTVAYQGGQVKTYNTETQQSLNQRQAAAITKTLAGLELSAAQKNLENVLYNEPSMFKGEGETEECTMTDHIQSWRGMSSFKLVNVETGEVVYEDARDASELIGPFIKNNGWLGLVTLTNYTEGIDNHISQPEAKKFLQEAHLSTYKSIYSSPGNYKEYYQPMLKQSLEAEASKYSWTEEQKELEWAWRNFFFGFENGDLTSDVVECMKR